MLWVRSYWVSDIIFYGGGAGEYVVQAGEGVIALGSSGVAHARRTVHWERWPWPFGPVVGEGAGGSFWSAIGFGYEVDGVPTGPLRFREWPGKAPAAMRSHLLWVPMWFVVGVLACLPAWWLYLARRRLRRAFGHLCPCCGYDLRATPGRCPECGQVPAAQPPPP